MLIDLRKDAPDQMETIDPDKLSTEVEKLQTIQREIQELEDIPILLPSALEEQNICKNEYLLKSYVKFCEKNSIKKAYIKWHPAHTNQSRKYFIKKFIVPQLKLIRKQRQYTGFEKMA